MMFNLGYPLAVLSLVWGTRAGPVGRLTPERRPLLGAVGRPLGAAPSAVSPIPRLTSERLTQLQNLLQALHHVPQPVQDAAKGYTDTVTPDLNVPGLPPISGSSFLRYRVVNWGTMATHSPAVAAAFTQAHLAPHDYLPVLTAVISAGLDLQILGVLKGDLADTSIAIVEDTATVLEKNIEFAHRHLALIRTIRKSYADYVTQVNAPGAPTAPSGQGTPSNGTLMPLPPL